MTTVTDSPERFHWGTPEDVSKPVSVGFMVAGASLCTPMIAAALEATFGWQIFLWSLPAFLFAALLGAFVVFSGYQSYRTSGSVGLLLINGALGSIILLGPPALAALAWRIPMPASLSHIAIALPIAAAGIFLVQMGRVMRDYHNSVELDLVRRVVRSINNSPFGLTENIQPFDTFDRIEVTIVPNACDADGCRPLASVALMGSETANLHTLDMPAAIILANQISAALDLPVVPIHNAQDSA